MTISKLPGLLTISEAAEAIEHSVSEWTLRREIARGNLRARRIGRCLRISETELRRWIESPGLDGPGGGQDTP